MLLYIRHVLNTYTEYMHIKQFAIKSKRFPNGFVSSVNLEMQNFFQSQNKETI